MLNKKTALNLPSHLGSKLTLCLHRTRRSMMQHDKRQQNPLEPVVILFNAVQHDNPIRTSHVSGVDMV